MATTEEKLEILSANLDTFFLIINAIIIYCKYYKNTVTVIQNKQKHTHTKVNDILQGNSYYRTLQVSGGKIHTDKQHDKQDR